MGDSQPLISSAMGVFTSWQFRLIVSISYIIAGRFLIQLTAHDRICGLARTSKDEFFFLGGLTTLANFVPLLICLSQPRSIRLHWIFLGPHQSVLVLSSTAFIVLQTRASIERPHFTPSTRQRTFLCLRSKLASTKWNVSMRRRTSLSLLHMMPAYWAYYLSFLGQLPLGIIRTRKSSVGGDS